MRQRTAAPLRSNWCATLEERQMDLSEDIRLKVEKHGEKDIILDVMKSLQDDGVMITEDVYEAIVTTLRFTQGMVDN